MEPIIKNVNDSRVLAWEAEQFLILEASILDHEDYQKWLSMLSNDFLYQIPIRLTKERNAESAFSKEAYHMYEDKGSLELRVLRIYSDYNFVEQPPSRCRHFLTNFRVENFSQENAKTELLIKYNILLFRNKFDLSSYELLSGEREDILRKEKGEWKLAKRTIWLDHTTMGMSNLGIFL